MRTNIVINEDLMAKAMKISKHNTKKDVVETALREYVSNHSKKNLMDLQGQIQFADDYDYKALREGRES